MKVFLYVVGGTLILIAVAAGIAALVGSRLPQSHVVTRELLFRQPPMQVYAVVRNFRDAPTWRTDVTRIEVFEEAGQVRFREEGRHGTVNYGLVEDVPGQRLVTKILDTDLGYAGNWTYVFAPSGEGTRLAITENGEVPNVLFRFMSRFVFGQTSTIDGYLKALARRLDTP
jgi:hypothetical protein